MADRKCTRCGKTKPIDQFVKDARQSDGREMSCRPCRNAYLREYNASYTKTKFGFIMRLYRNMKSRIDGVQRQKSHLYAGKSLLSKDQFYEWAETHPSFRALFEAWETADYARPYTPTVDRVDPARGYELDNMEWVTHSENSRRGTISKVRQGLVARKLTAEAVRDIRNSAARRSDLAERYGVSISTIYKIRAGRRWK